MKREMRRKDRELPEEEAIRILKESRFGILCTVCADGHPYGIPMHHALEGRTLYMHCSCEGGLKLENIARSDKACFTAIAGTAGTEEGFTQGPRSAVAFGRVQIATGEEERRTGLEALRRGRPQRQPDNAGNASKVLVLRFDIEELTGKGR